MASERTSTSLLDDPEPPFLQESTVVVDSRPLRPGLDEIVDVVYRWRVALAFGLVPIVLTAIAVTYDAEAPGDPVLGADDGRSSFEAIVDGIEAGDELPPGPTGILASGDLGELASVPPPTEPPAPAAAAVPTTPAPTTTAPTTEATTTTAEPTTSAPTTEATTTAPTTEATTTETTAEATTTLPDPIPACLVTIKGRSNLFAQPDSDSDRLDRIERGTYLGLGRTDDGDWYRIVADGTLGWVRERRVSDVIGDC